jgi:hypothetical protein
MASIIEQLVQELSNDPRVKGRFQKHTSPSAAVGPYMHGPGGLFGVSGLERDVISSRVQPQGLASLLDVSLTQVVHPLYAYITGFQAASGNQPTDPCADGPIAGAMKSCLQTAKFGSYQFETRPMDLCRVGQRNDRGEFFDLRIMNDPLVDELAGLFPTLPSQDAMLNGQELLSRLVEVGVAFQDLLSRQVYQATGVANEFPGLDILVGETKVDAQTGVDCPALYSDIRDFGYVDVSTPAGSSSIVQTLISVWRNLNNNASTMNFGQTEWVIVMRKNLFHEITDVWPCNYMSYRCIPENSNIEVSVSADEQVRMRDSMRMEDYLLIDGVRVNVVTDDSIFEEGGFGGGVGTYASDIYILPLTVRSGLSVTYFEMFDFQNGTVPDIRLGRSETDFWTDDGRYLWMKKPANNWCTQWKAKTDPRVKLLTPQLAGRIVNVAYTPLKPYRDPFPEQYNFQNGGVTDARPAPSYWADWNPPA